MSDIAHALGKDIQTFLVGCDRTGQWVAIETHGLGGGLFASRDAAVRYAEYETDHRPRAARLANELVELKI